MIFALAMRSPIGAARKLGAAAGAVDFVCKSDPLERIVAAIFSSPPENQG